MKFRGITSSLLSVRIYLLVVIAICHQAIGYAQCADPCQSGGNVTLHFDYDNFCADDTAMLWLTWDNNFVPDSFYWRLEGPNGQNPLIVSPTDNDTIFVVGGFQAWYFGYVVDTSGCCEESNGWLLYLPYTPLFDAIIEPSHCNEPTGSITLSLLPGGLGGDVMTYLWSDGSTNPFLLNVPAGTYTVMVIRENLQGMSCPVEYSYTVPLIDTLHLEATLQMDNSCASDNGAIDLTVTYAGLDYDYQWSNGSNEEDLENIPPGTYAVTVTGPSPCVATATYVIADESSPLDLVLEDITPTYCDLPVGMADISVIGGAEPITYQWSDFETTQDAFQLTSGTHYVTVTGEGDCTAVLEVYIPNYDSLFSVSATITSNTNCLTPNGAINLHPQPEGFYTYSWPNSNEEDLTNLASGVYPVKINAGTCVLLDTFFVADNTSFPSLSAAITETICGDSSGMIDLEVSNGIMPYNYFWSDSSSTQDRANLAAGFYSVTVTGQNGCAASDTFSIQAGSPDFTLVTTIASNSGCASPNGSIDLSLLPADTFSFLWSTGATTEDIDQLQQNIYTVTITHDLLCTYVYAFQVLDSLSPPDTTHIVQTSCNMLQVGLDTLVLQNQIGCDSVLVVNTAFLPIDTSFQIGMACDPGSEGTVIENIVSTNGCDSIVVTDYLFMGIDTSHIISSTCDPSIAGVYYQIYTNGVGCDSVVETTVLLSTSDTTIIQGSTCDGTQSGIFYTTLANVFGCDSIVQEEISFLPSHFINTAATTCNVSEAGVFVDSLVNQYGCDSVVTHVISLLPGDTTFINNMTCFPDEVGVEDFILTNQLGCDSVVVVSTVQFPLPEVALHINSDYNGYPISCFEKSDGSLQVTFQGVAPFDIEWSSGQTDAIIHSLEAGWYTVTITDGNACQVESSIELIDPDPIVVTLEIAHPTCFDAMNGSIRVLFSGGVEPALFSIDGVTFQDSPLFENLGGGMYEISVLDANDCMANEILFINTPIALTVQLGDDQIISIADSTSVEAIINVPYEQLASIDWSGLENSSCPNCLTQVVAPVVSTTYSIVIRDELGCSAEDSMTVFVKKDSGLYLPNVFSPNHDQINDHFLISASEDIQQIERFVIYDRWGNLVFIRSAFPPNDISHAWDGTYKQSPLNAGVFAYVIMYRDNGDYIIRQGNITLIR